MDTDVKDTSLLALKTFEELEPDQRAVMELLEEIGPAHDRRILEALNQKEQKTIGPKKFKRRWEINQVTARRNELVKLGLVLDIGKYSGTWNNEKKVYHFWRTCGDEREPAGWERLPDEPHKAPVVDEKCATCRYRQECLSRNAERPIAEKLNASQAGSVLGKFGHDKKKTPETQTSLFG